MKRTPFKQSRSKDFGILLILILCPLALGWSYYTMCNVTAERYNANLGTNYTAVDIMLGVHNTARDIR